jgi:riboflavin kinase/FMN adenylyltransferase
MRLIRGLPECEDLSNGSAVTIGNFDGVHLGHQAVVERLAAEGHRLGLPVVVVLFEPQPREYFEAGRAPARLTRLREKLARFKELPIDIVLLLRFDQRLADMPADTFIERILVDGLRVRYLLVGDDFRFGKNRRGDFALLQAAGKRYGFEVTDTNSIRVGGCRISSTWVREALSSGDLATAERLLGRPYSICGRVVHGDNRGRALGFPTVNIRLQRKKTPVQGVYAVTMAGLGEQELPGVANVGTRPTLDGKKVLLEVHLFNLDRDLYGRQVEVRFRHKIRDERRFANIEELRAQIAKDSLIARQLLHVRALGSSMYI